MSRRTSQFRLPLWIAAGVISLFLCAESAVASTRTIAPARQKATSVEFKLKKLVPADITSASLTVGKRKLKLKLSVVRKAASKGVLKVKLPKSVRKGAKGNKKPRVRLRLVLKKKLSPPLPGGGGPPPVDPFPGDYPVVAAAGDIACDPSDVDYNGGNGTSTNCRHKYTAPLLAGSDAVLALGDTGYGPNALSASYDPTWGAYRSITHPITADHEYDDVGLSTYEAYFGSAAGPAGQYWYSFDLPSAPAWHFIALNSNCDRVACDAASAQVAWLKNDLATHPAKCTLVYWHHPHFTDGGHGPDEAGSTAEFWDAALAAGADVVLHGNDHGYQRWPKMLAPGLLADNGIREFVVGTGGKSHQAMVGSVSTVRNDNTFGVLKLQLRPTGYDWKFVPEASRTFTDAGSDTCS